MGVKTLEGLLARILARYPWVKRAWAAEDWMGLLVLVEPEGSPSLFQLVDLWWDLKGALEPEGLIPRVKLATGPHGAEPIYERPD